MSHKKTNRKQVKKNKALPVATIPSCNTRMYLEDFTPQEIQQALLPLSGGSCPLEELIATANAAFNFVNSADLDNHIREAFWQLEKLFSFYSHLVQTGMPRGMLAGKD
jgi:hypothetical protein